MNGVVIGVIVKNQIDFITEGPLPSVISKLRVPIF
jgi:hypothetical protein